MKKLLNTAMRTIASCARGLSAHHLSGHLRLLLLLTLLFSAASAFADEKNDRHEIKIEVVGDSKVNVRTGPSTEYEVIGQLAPGEAMWVKGEPNLEKEWVEASRMGLSGYVNTAYVRIVEESHARDSYKGLDFFPVPEFCHSLKIWAWNLIVIFLALLIALWILFAIMGKDGSFGCALSVACTACIIWYTCVLGSDAFWFTDPHVSGGWWWTIGYSALFLVLGFVYLYISGIAVALQCEDLDELGHWVWCIVGVCLYLILSAVARWWVDWTIWPAYVALAVGVLVQAYKVLVSAGFFPTLLFLFTGVGVYIILEPLLYILAVVAVFCLVAVAFLKGSTNTGSAPRGSGDVQYEIVDGSGKTVTVTCSSTAPTSGRGDDGNRYELWPDGNWHKVG